MTCVFRVQTWKFWNNVFVILSVQPVVQLFGWVLRPQTPRTMWQPHPFFCQNKPKKSTCKISIKALIFWHLNRISMPAIYFKWQGLKWPIMFVLELYISDYEYLCLSTRSSLDYVNFLTYDIQYRYYIYDDGFHRVPNLLTVVKNCLASPLNQFNCFLLIPLKLYWFIKFELK